MAMDRNSLVFYIVVGIGLLFLIPVVESVDQSLVPIASFLVIGYWGGMGFCFFLYLLKKLCAEYQVGFMLYNLWLFLSLMCVAVGILAIIDDGVDQARWGVLLIFYGSIVGYYNRKEL